MEEFVSISCYQAGSLPYICTRLTNVLIGKPDLVSRVERNSIVVDTKGSQTRRYGAVRYCLNGKHCPMTAFSNIVSDIIRFDKTGRPPQAVIEPQTA